MAFKTHFDGDILRRKAISTGSQVIYEAVKGLMPPLPPNGIFTNALSEQIGLNLNLLR